MDKKIFTILRSKIVFIYKTYEVVNSANQTIIQIHFPRFQLVFYSQLEEIPKDIMSAVECSARLFILDQIHW